MSGDSAQSAPADTSCDAYHKQRSKLASTHHCIVNYYDADVTHTALNVLTKSSASTGMKSSLDYWNL